MLPWTGSKVDVDDGENENLGAHSVVEAFFPFIKRGVDSPNFALLFSD